MDQTTLFFNGIDISKNTYARTPIEMDRYLDRVASKLDHSAHKGLKYGVNAGLLEEAGWGIILPEELEEELFPALEPLIQHRRSQTGGARFGIYTYFEGESKHEFLVRHGVGPGTVDPDQFPYYLLIIGSPQAIPFEFQYQLDIAYAVGRLCLPNLDAYGNYVRNLIEYETQTESCNKELVLFGVANEGDPLSHLFRENLLGYLHEELSRLEHRWHLNFPLRHQTNRAQLGQFLSGNRKPDLLMTSCHGVHLPGDDENHRAHQGGLICGDWPGSNADIEREHYFIGDDLPEDGDLRGLICFNLSCYSAGTPLPENQGMIAALPQKMLGHEQAALAVIGHVDQTFNFNFCDDATDCRPATFTSVLRGLMNGEPVGLALERFNQVYAELAAEVALNSSKTPSDRDKIFRLAMMDARHYIVLGDPAARLMRL